MMIGFGHTIYLKKPSGPSPSPVQEVRGVQVLFEHNALAKSPFFLGSATHVNPPAGSAAKMFAVGLASKIGVSGSASKSITAHAGRAVHTGAVAGSIKEDP